MLKNLLPAPKSLLLVKSSAPAARSSLPAPAKKNLVPVLKNLLLVKSSVPAARNSLLVLAMKSLVLVVKSCLPAALTKVLALPS